MATQESDYDRLDYRSLRDAVFLKLKEEILSGKLKPGQRLQQGELANRFNISRMPVRDALHKLEAEGLVTVYPVRGATVSQLDLDELQEVYRIREVLEGLAAKLAAPNVTADDLARMRQLSVEMETAERQGDLGAWLQSDREFHDCPRQRCRSPRLLKLITEYWNTTQHFRRAYCMLPGRIQHAEEMHRRLLAALEARDAELFADLMRAHVRESVRGILEVQPNGLDGAMDSKAKDLV